MLGRPIGFGKEMECDRVRSVVWMKLPPNSTPARRLVVDCTASRKVFLLRSVRLTAVPNNVPVFRISFVLRLASRLGAISYFLFGYSFRVASRTESELSAGSRVMAACCQAPSWLKRLTVWTYFRHWYCSPGRV